MRDKPFRRAVSVCGYAVSLISLLGFGCGAPATMSLRLRTADAMPKTSHVSIDDEQIGSLPFVMKRGVALPPGRHRITIEAEGCFPWDQEIEAGTGGGLLEVPVKLIRMPE